MKNILKSTILILVFVIIAVGCKKNDDSLNNEPYKNPIANKPLAEQKKYIFKYVKQATLELAKALKQQSIRIMINKKAAAKPTGDYEVLIKDLMKEKQFINAINFEKMQESIDAFKGINGKDLQLQVYTHFLSNTNSSTQVTGESDLDEDPEFVIPDGDETIVEFDGYELGSNDDLVLSGRRIDEAYAKIKPVYLIAFNEGDYYGDNPNYTMINQLPPIIAAKPPVNPPTNPADLNVRVDEMIIYDIKEGWVKGRPEISIMGNMFTWNGRTNGDPSSPRTRYIGDINPGTTDGLLMFKPDRNEVFAHKNFSVNYNMQRHWLIDYSDIKLKPCIMAYVIFEEDDWPAGNTLAEIKCYEEFPNQSEWFTYQSADYSYNNGYFYITNKALPAWYSIPNYLDFYNDGTMKDVRQQTAGAKYNLTQYYR